MAEFTEAQKTEIVQRLACFEGPASIVADFKRQGIATDSRQVGSYDPTRPYFEAGDRWREVFEAHRKKFTEDLEGIPTANKACRVNLLHEAALKARDKGNIPLMAQLLKQIAEDCGGALTNERRFGIDGIPAAALPAEEQRAKLAALLDQMSSVPANAPSVVTEQ